MKRLNLPAVLLFVLCGANAFAATPPNPADYTIAVHVSSSRTIQQCVEYVGSPYCYPVLVLNASIDGTKYELRGGIVNTSKEAKFSDGDGYLALADYKAKVLPNKMKSPSVPYFVMKNYELLLSDGRIAQFQVTGQLE